MNEAERRYLDYRPALGLTRELRYLAEAVGLTPEQAGSYQLPAALADAAAILAADVLEHAAQTRDRADALLSALEKGLAALPGPVPFAAYQRAKAEADPEIVSQFDGFHAGDLDGTVQGELLPLIGEVRDELADLVPLVQETFFPEGVDHADLSTAREEEVARLKQAIISEMKSQGSTDLSAMAVRAQLLHAAGEQVENGSSFLDEAESVLRHTVNDQFNGKAREAVEQLAAAAPAARAGLADLNLLRFRQLVHKARRVRGQLSALDRRAIRKTAWRTVTDLQKRRRTSVAPTLQWLGKVDLQWGRNPTVGLITSAVELMEQLDRELRSAMLDLYKQNRLEASQRKELLGVIRGKKEARHVSRLLGAMELELGPVNAAAPQQARRLVENQGWEKPGQIMTI